MVLGLGALELGIRKARSGPKRSFVRRYLLVKRFQCALRGIDHGVRGEQWCQDMAVCWECFYKLKSCGLTECCHQPPRALLKQTPGHACTALRPSLLRAHAGNKQRYRDNAQRGHLSDAPDIVACSPTRRLQLSGHFFSVIV